LTGAFTGIVSRMQPLANHIFDPRCVEATTPDPERPASDPAELMRTCANCGSRMEERKCKLICHGCGYFLSCSDYY
jgi:hypothetical protein